MKHTRKVLAIASVLAFSLSGVANASITASVKTVCEKAEQTSANQDFGKNTGAQQAYSNMLSQHFSLTSCNGMQLLNNAPHSAESENSEGLEREVASLTD